VSEVDRQRGVAIASVRGGPQAEPRYAKPLGSQLAPFELTVYEEGLARRARRASSTSSSSPPSDDSHGVHLSGAGP